MNDDNKVVNQKTPPAIQTDQATPQVQVQPVTPVGSVNKEVGPINALALEFVKPSEVEPQIDQDLKELGVEAKKEKPDLTSEHKEVGIEHAGSHISVSTVPSGKVTLPMSEEEIAEKLKTGQDDDSSKWLAGLINKVIAVMGFRAN
jgi:hypothetical protein